LKAPNREESISSDEAWTILEEQANADWRWHGIKMLLVGVFIGLVGLCIGLHVVSSS